MFESFYIDVIVALDDLVDMMSDQSSKFSTKFQTYDFSISIAN